MKISTRPLVQTALLLALCIVFQCLKSISVYITGPAVNAVLIIATLSVGLYSGLLIAATAPVVAFFLGATPVMNLIPWMIPIIIVGNSILVLAVWLFKQKNLMEGLLTGSVCKAAFLWLTVWYVILPFFQTNIPEAKRAIMIPTIKTTFSVTQLITALIGSVLAFLIWKPLHKYLKAEN